MPGSMDSQLNFFKRLWADIQRRRVARVGITYLGLGWGALAGGELVLEIVAAPDWVFRAAVSVVALGFPITLVVAWVFDIDDGQIVRTKEKSFRMGRRVRAILGVPVIIMVVASSWWVWEAYVAEKERSLRPTDLGDEVPIVAITPIRNLTGDPTLDWFGEGIVNLVRDNLSNSRFLHVASPQRWNAITQDVTDSIEIGRVAAENDIGFIVSGEMLQTPDGIYVSTRLSDSAGGLLLSANQVENLKPQSILQAAGPIATQVRKGLGVPREEQVDMFVADFAIDNLEAYEFYIRGLVKFVDWEIEQAKVEFEAALELAPDFGVARLRLAHLQAIDSETVQARQNMSLAAEDPFLLPREQQYVAAYLAFFSGNYDVAEKTASAILAEYPYEVEAREILGQVYLHRYQLPEAAAIYEELVLELPRNEGALAWLGDIYLQLGKTVAAGDIFKRYLEVAPDSPNPYLEMARWARASGDYDAALKYLDQAVSILPSMPGAATLRAELLYIGGQSDAALKAFQEVAQTPVYAARERIDAMFHWVSLLAADGKYAEAAAQLKAFEPLLQSESVRYPMALSRLGLLQLQMGDVEAAKQSIESSLTAVQTVPTRHLFARAQWELATGAIEAALATANEIRQLALPPDDPDRTEEKAASYIQGQVAQVRGETASTVAALRTAVSLEGYEYALYGGALAEALIEQGELADGRAILDRELQVDPNDLRIDLETERRAYSALREEIDARSVDP